MQSTQEINMEYEFCFSVIIPHKNTTGLLQRCLNSIPKRANIQIIVVDDNSDENIVDFDSFPGLTDPNIEVYFTKEGKGAGYARNVGLRYAKGRWLLFADADDYFAPNAFQYLFSKIDSSCDLIFFKTICYTSDTYEPAERMDVYITNNMIDDFINKIKGSAEKIRYQHCIPAGKMIKHDLVKKYDILFDEVIASNDVMFALNVGHYASSIDVNNDIIYYLTVSRGSLTNTYSLLILNARYLVALRQNNFLKKNGKRQYQVNIAKYLFLSWKYGIKTFLYFIKLAIQYRNNPFIEIHLWFRKYVTWVKSNQKKVKYIIEKD